MYLLKYIVPSIIYYANTISSYFINYTEGYFLTDTKLKHNTSGIIKKTNLVIVAHPDDDILWFGEFLIKNSDSTKVLCITGANNDIRSKEFIKVMNALNVSYEMWDYVDTKKHIGSLELEGELKKICEKFYNIYTHSSCGETGHPQHIMLHDYVYFIAKEKLHVFSNKPFSQSSLSNKKAELLSFYKSQKNVINNNIYLSMRENHVHYSNV
jgi:hypothetical protein